MATEAQTATTKINKPSKQGDCKNNFLLRKQKNTRLKPNHKGVGR